MHVVGSGSLPKSMAARQGNLGLTKFRVQVVRAPAPLPGAELILELWAGGGLRVVDVPSALPTRIAQEPSDDTQDALL